MKRKTCRLFVEDIVESIDKIESYIENMTYEMFVENSMAVDAVIRTLKL